MTKSYTFNEAQLDFYLRFQNPLSIVSDEWHDRSSDLSGMRITDLDYVIEDIFDREEGLEGYTLVGEHENMAMQVDCYEPQEPSNENPKPKSLAEKMQAASEKVKTQDAKGKNAKFNDTKLNVAKGSDKKSNEHEER